MKTYTKDELTKILADHKEWRASGGRSGARADLADANLARADLADADLTHAYLADADLTRANLADAYLAGANLTRAYLADADLTRADLTRADLTRANLADAYLAGANLTRANLADADLADANLARAIGLPTMSDDPQPKHTREEWEANPAKTATERAKRYREKHPDVPVVEALDAKILRAIEAGGALEMNNWHTCQTTHCRAGWAIHLAGEAGYALERQYDPAFAGRMIYLASTGRAPHFYDMNNDRVLEDIKRCAAEQTAGATR